MQIKYYDYYKNCKDISKIRFEMVNLAKKIGYKPTAKKFQTTVKIVKKWVKRYNEGGLEAIKDRSKKPNRIPNKILPYWEFKILNICKNIKFENNKINISKVKRDYNIPYSITTIYKTIIKNNFSSIINKKSKEKRSFTKLVMFNKESDEIIKLYREYIQYILR